MASPDETPAKPRRWLRIALRVVIVLVVLGTIGVVIAYMIASRRADEALAQNRTTHRELLEAQEAVDTRRPTLGPARDADAREVYDRVMPRMTEELTAVSYTHLRAHET